MKKLYSLPNCITCCNLLCGAVACYFAFQASYGLTFLFIVAGAIFDFFDGFAARLINQSSPIGKELDSLADIITFGLAPSAAVFSLLQQQCATISSPAAPYLPFAALLMAAFSALRLAKFNLDERQTMGFIGLPTPANALFWISLVYCFGPSIPQTLTSVAVLIIGVVVAGFLLVGEVPMFALKFKNFGWSDNATRYLFIAASAVMLCVFREAAFCYIIPLYILISVGLTVFAKQQS